MWQWENLAGRDCDLFGVSATGEKAADLVADFPALRVALDLFNDTRALQAEGVGHAFRWRVVASGLQQVSAVYASGFDLDQHLPILESRFRSIGPFQGAGVGKISLNDCLHSLQR